MAEGATLGLFTRTDAKQGLEKEKPAKQDAAGTDAARRLGVAGARNMNPHARHPNMEPTGSVQPAVLVLGEAPGEQEDERGRQLVGAAGQKLREYIPREWLPKVRWDNVCRTRPVRREHGELVDTAPTPFQIECFRDAIEEDIAAHKPKAVLACGPLAVRWFLGNLGRTPFSTLRGRRFPAEIRGHRLWVYPVHHPSFVIRLMAERDGKGGRFEDVPGREWERAFGRDVQRVFDDLEDGKCKAPKVRDPASADLTTFDGSGGAAELKRVRRVLRQAGEYREGVVGIDIETSTLRPYAAGAKLLSVGIAFAGKGYSFAFDHPGAGWDKQQKEKLLKSLRRFLRSKADKVAHNLSMELEWFVWLFGKSFADERGWEDTMQAAYVLDERKQGHSLDLLTGLHLGFRIKQVAGIDRSRLEFAEVSQVLRYNAGDAYWTADLHNVLQRQIKEEGLSKVYRRQVRRVPSCVLAQFEGVPVNEKQVRAYKKDYQSRIDNVLEKIASDRDVRAFEKRYGKGSFVPTSNPVLVSFFKGFLGRKEGQRGKGYSTDEEALVSMGKLPIAKMILDLRKVQKLKSTYINPLDRASKETVVFPDGKLHTTYNTARTATSRLSSEDPNLQNFPKRKNAEMRAMVHAPPGMLMLACDFGQLEYRVIGMASRDPVVVDSVWRGYDVHMVWAKKLAKLYPRLLEQDHKGEIDKLRSAVKNQWVFPAFYGSSLESIAGNLRVPSQVLRGLFAEFWTTFKGVKRWQQDLARQYEREFCIRMLTGRIRRGPMSFNMVINSGIQGAASDLVIDAMDALRKRAVEERRYYLAPVLNVHDDLTFLIPEKGADAIIEEIITEMVRVRYKWVNVPLAVEAAVGRDWHKMDKLGTFTSDKMAA